MIITYRILRDLKVMYVCRNWNTLGCDLLWAVQPCGWTSEWWDVAYHTASSEKCHFTQNWWGAECCSEPATLWQDETVTQDWLKTMWWVGKGFLKAMAEGKLLKGLHCSRPNYEQVKASIISIAFHISCSPFLMPSWFCEANLFQSTQLVWLLILNTKISCLIIDIKVTRVKWLNILKWILWRNLLFSISFLTFTPIQNRLSLLKCFSLHFLTSFCWSMWLMVLQFDLIFIVSLSIS